MPRQLAGSASIPLGEVGGMEIGIVGLGLIGGSLAIDLSRLGYRVTGVSRRQQTCDRALGQNIAAVATTDLASLAAAQVVFVCTPVAAIVPTVAQLAEILDPAAVITDVGSVKAAIVPAATQHWPQFVGGHPMSGTAEAGLEAAVPDLFRRRPYVLTPLPETNAVAVAQVAHIADQLAAVRYTASPVDHDRAVAQISHLPVLLGASLIQSCQTADPAVRQLAQQLASSGFRDTSRVGGGNPELGRMMAEYNKTAVLEAIAAYRDQLDQLTAAITADRWAAVEAYLTQAQQARPAFVEMPDFPAQS